MSVLLNEAGPVVVLMLTRMNRILEIDLRNRMAVVEAGVCNLRLTQALAGTGYHFAPDPSSQGASTIGGNVATNAGGPHTLKYGVTVNHVLGIEAVLCDGSVTRQGGEEICPWRFQESECLPHRPANSI